jgi:hypothetical protein
MLDTSTVSLLKRRQFTQFHFTSRESMT